MIHLFAGIQIICHGHNLLLGLGRDVFILICHGHNLLLGLGRDVFILICHGHNLLLPSGLGMVMGLSAFCMVFKEHEPTSQLEQGAKELVLSGHARSLMIRWLLPFAFKRIDCFCCFVFLPLS